jgi:hypothetical protein
METLNFKGSAAVGMFLGYKTSIATLSVTHTNIELNLHFLIKLCFDPSDNISFIRYRILPFFKDGILIKHSNPKYKKHIVFWPDESFNDVVSKIKECGFSILE